MKKSFLFLLIALAGTITLQAKTVDSQLYYIHSSDFNAARAAAALAIGTNLKAGIEAKYIMLDKNMAEKAGIDKNVYAVSMPWQIDLDLVKINLTPFYYFKNSSTDYAQEQGWKDPSAYGLNTQLVMELQADEVEDLYTQAYIGVSYANQKGTLFKNGGVSDKEDFSQMAYTLGLRQSFFQAFTFHTAGTVYQYPNGITGVDRFRGIMDQQDLAFTQTFDYTRDLGKYALSARITRVWAETGSTLYGAYRYGEFYTSKPEHSFIVGNSFHVAKEAKLDVAYNHVQTTAGTNKRDLLYINLGIGF